MSPEFPQSPRTNIFSTENFLNEIKKFPTKCVEIFAQTHEKGSEFIAQFEPFHSLEERLITKEENQAAAQKIKDVSTSL